MGTGVVDPYDRSPADKWNITVNLLNSKRFRDLVRDLISGQPVRSDDTEVQISFERVSDTRLNIRIREADSAVEAHVLDPTVEAVDPADLDQPDGVRLASPVPGQMDGGTNRDDIGLGAVQLPHPLAEGLQPLRTSPLWPRG